MAALLVGATAQAQVTTYDADTNVVTIPSVSVGTASYTNVTLRNRGEFVFELLGATEQKPAAPGMARYDVGTRVLTLPAVKVGAATFLDVTLKDVGNYVFTLQTATELSASVTAELEAFARELERQFAAGVPPTGVARMALTDNCWRNNGRTRGNFIADYDINIAAYAQRDAFAIGRTVRNLQVLALRNGVNPDGSTRREIELQYDLFYRDGTVQRDTQTLISGSSFGTPGCGVAQNSPALRALGNQQLVQTAVRANNLRDERYSLASGNALSPAVQYRREVQFQIVDPMGNANYVIVTGPGPTTTIDGTVHPFSLKFLSPRLLMSAPELQGKPGNFVNWLDTDGFRNCRLASGALPVVAVVDCVAQGATNSSWGFGFTANANAASDQSFAAQGWVAGGVYRFDVYADDGWKTVNGHVGKTPIGTYHATLDRLPYTFVEMADKYPRIDLGGMSTAQLAANATSASPTPLSIAWTRPGLLPSGRSMHLFQGWEFHQGAQVGNAGGAFNPAFRTINFTYPGTTATSTSGFPVTAARPGQNGKSYTEYNLYYAEPGTFNSIQSRISLQ
ncbi:hypothetical protein [Ideonella sp. A 288]|uniref:hypothetical protein n=1 Tax=Ideonella sp. A 288 TaxID=1962181 RepID=UPI001186C057|nr:hypothetical protein [Ideonella sp. A 288]